MGDPLSDSNGSDEQERTEAIAKPQTMFGWQDGLPSSLPCRFGRYELQKELGRGGMGAVYLAHDSQLQRRVALKIPLFAGSHATIVRERFVREARAAATVEHPGICPIFDVGQHEGTHFLTMAFIEGQPLARMLRERGPLPQRQAAILVRRIALAMAEAHSRGIVHRDLKPGNVMINRRGEPVVMDFGLACVASGDDDVRLTRTGTAMGTPSYMPPEQLNGELDKIGPGTDVYALGVILYELLAGRPPFAGRPAELMAQVLYSEPASLTTQCADVSRSLETICLKALAKDPANRFLSMAEFADAIRQYLDQTAAPSESVTAASIFSEMADQFAATVAQGELPRRAVARRSPWPWLVAIAAVLIALTIGLVSMLRTPNGQAVIELDNAETRAEVRVDGNRVQTGIRFDLKPGKHRIEATAPGYEPYSSEFETKPGEFMTVTVRLQPRKFAAVEPGKKTAAKKADPRPVVQRRVTDFREIHSTDLKGLEDWLSGLKAEGYRPSYVSSHVNADPPRFNAIAIKDGSGIDWNYRVRFGIAPNKSVDLAWRNSDDPMPVATLYTELGEMKICEISFKAPGAGPSRWTGSWKLMLDRFAELRRQDLRPIGFSGVRFQDGVAAFCQWAENDKLEWSESFDLTTAQMEVYAQKAKEFYTKNWRLDVLNAYPTANNDFRFGIVMVEDRSNPPWSLQVSITKAELETALTEQRKKKMRPHAIVSYADTLDPRYTVLWMPFEP